MSELSYIDWRDRIRAAVVARRGFSFLRVGDGEGIIIGYPEFVGEAEFDARIQKWSALEQPLKHPDRTHIANAVRAAVVAADIVGEPGDRHMALNQQWRNARRFLRYYSMCKHDRCEMDFSVLAQTRGDWPAILAGCKEVYCITCRCIPDKIQTAFGCERANMFILTPQVKPDIGPHITDESHYPILYRQCLSWISKNGKGNVFLVGAGGFGKIYCHTIQQCGGVAIDAGSLFDGWAGYATRSYLREKPERFKL